MLSQTAINSEFVGIIIGEFSVAERQRWDQGFRLLTS